MTKPQTPNSLGFGLWDLGFGIWDLGFGFWDFDSGLSFVGAGFPGHRSRDAAKVAAGSNRYNSCSMGNTYNAIVVGARCAGSPAALLLARKGYKVLVVDRATFPSDTVSTHILHPLGVAALRRWGLLDRLTATGCPPIHTYTIDFGPFTIAGSPGTADSPVAYCPRRTILDKRLVDAAAGAGAEIRENVVVEEILREDGRVVGIRGRSKAGAPVVERADVVIGADGRHSLVAETVRPDQYHEKPPLLAAYYSYWSNLPMNGRFETYVRPNRGFAAAPTHDGQTMVVLGWPYAEFEANRKDVEGYYMKTLALVPEFMERVRAAKREGPISGAFVPNYFRKPFGPGWALVGDAGYNKDPITAQGITDAFRDAERCVAAIDEALSGARPFDAAMADYQRARDEHVLPMYEFTCQLAALEPPSPQMQQLFAAIARNQQAMDGFVQVNAGTISPAAFFTPEKIGAIMAAAHPAGT
jgi:2-polyprenyl-6-methoxyphenol hydroxylase-like FAD-dependent oxidoreductase